MIEDFEKWKLEKNEEIKKFFKNIEEWKEEQNKKQQIELDDIKRNLDIYASKIERNIISKFINEVEVMKKQTIQEIKEDTEFLLESPEFINPLFIMLNKRLEKTIDHTISIKLKPEEIHSIIGNFVSSKINDNLKEIISEVIEKQMKYINKKLEREYNIAKSLSLSIDSQIKGIVRNANINYSEGEEIKKLIISSFKKEKEVLLLNAETYKD